MLQCKEIQCSRMYLTHKTLSCNQEKYHSLKPIKVKRTAYKDRKWKKGIPKVHYTNYYQTKTESLQWNMRHRL